MTITEKKALDIYITGSGVVSKQDAPYVLKELDKYQGVFYGDIEMNDLVLIERS